MRETTPNRHFTHSPTGGIVLDPRIWVHDQQSATFVSRDTICTKVKRWLWYLVLWSSFAISCIFRRKICLFRKCFPAQVNRSRTKGKWRSLEDDRTTKASPTAAVCRSDTLTLLVYWTRSERSGHHGTNQSFESRLGYIHTHTPRRSSCDTKRMLVMNPRD